ncbi:enoyl-CoA hydratase/isomerase family protein [Actinopolymorpha alba]|uniref:enoyl-CoA hydratase/isomerase family protein n=1 Tax=Actinopolymorpha alba TaxID=533267 RepID=UPI000369CE6F|nr:enoyl-CoA hydratase/isomerase family protein [Actinopolymorpha alba]
MRLERFRLELVEPGVALLTFDRPPVNAQDRRTREELVWLADAIAERDDIRAVVLTGAGKVFSAGADIKERVTIEGGAADYLRHNRVTRESFFALTDCPKPVIAALNGPAIGAGYALAAGCDIIVAAESAWIQMPELDRGLMGGAKFLEQHLPRTLCRLLFFTGRRLGGNDLLRHGAVADVVPDTELIPTALGIAREIATKHPPAVAKAKATFNAVELMPLRDGYRFEQSVTYELSTTAYARESQQAFLERRPAEHTAPQERREGGARS